MTESVPRRASLEVLRAEASDELAVLIQERLLGGEDPWDFMEELPSAARHYRVLRQIALEYPELTPAVWRLLDETQRHRRWDPTVADAS